MKTEHLTEELIQQLSLAPEACDAIATQHLQSCALCAQRVADYKLMFHEIEAIPAPAFEFDLVNLLMAQIPPVPQATTIAQVPQPAQAGHVQKGANTSNHLNGKMQYSWWMIAAIVACLALVGLPFYYFRTDIQNMFSGLSIIVTYLIVISVILIAGFQVADEYRKYNDRINSLDLYK